MMSFSHHRFLPTFVLVWCAEHRKSRNLRRHLRCLLSLMQVVSRQQGRDDFVHEHEHEPCTPTTGSQKSGQEVGCSQSAKMAQQASWSWQDCIGVPHSRGVVWHRQGSGRKPWSGNAEGTRVVFHSPRALALHGLLNFPLPTPHDELYIPSH